MLTLSFVFTKVGLTASCFGMGATLSNFVGQWVVEKFGHVTSLMGSLMLSFIPLVLFAMMPETLGLRTSKMTKLSDQRRNSHVNADYVNMP